MINYTPRLKEFFLSLGYNEKEYLDIISGYYINRYKEEVLIKKVNDLHKFFLSVGYTEADIIKMVEDIQHYMFFLLKK